MQEYMGVFKAEGYKFGIVASRWNETITKNLVQGAVDCLLRHGADENDVVIAWVPGSFEIPLIAKQMAMSDKFDAIICLGAVIRGATSHYDLIAGQLSAGISQASLESSVPILFGVLTTDTIEQALERSGTKQGNKGFDTALSAIEMISLSDQLFINMYGEEISEMFADEDDDQSLEDDMEEGDEGEDDDDDDDDDEDDDGIEPVSESRYKEKQSKNNRTH